VISKPQQLRIEREMNKNSKGEVHQVFVEGSRVPKEESGGLEQVQNKENVSEGGEGAITSKKEYAQRSTPWVQKLKGEKTR